MRNELEKRIIVSMIENRHCLIYGLSNLSPDNFRNEQCIKLMQIIRVWEAEQRELSMETLIMSESTRPLMSGLASITPEITRFRSIMDLLLRHCQMDKVRMIGMRISELTKTMNENNYQDHREKISNELMNLGIDERRKPKRISEAVKIYIENLEKPETREIGSLYEYPDLDKYIGKITPGMVITVAAGTSIGKSIVGINFARSIGVHTSIMSYEMDWREVAMRYTAMESETPISKLRNKSYTQDEGERILALYRGIAYKDNILINDRPAKNIKNLASEIKTFCKIYNTKLIIIDHLLFTTAGITGRNNDLEAVCSEFKSCAMNNQVAIILLTQLNREKRDNEPNLWHIKDSSAIEQYSDIVMMLDRKLNEDGSEADNVLDVYIRKNRHGPKGKCKLWIDGSIMKIGHIPEHF